MAFRNSRVIDAPPTQVFAAFADGARLAIWWGPDGFTNTFQRFEFRPGGNWDLVMHGPDGKNYPNELVFTAIEPPGTISMRHVSQPRYVSTLTLKPIDGGGTEIVWEQDFENPDFARNMEHILVPANEQLLNRLSAEVLRAAG